MDLPLSANPSARRLADMALSLTGREEHLYPVVPPTHGGRIMNTITLHTETLS